jgi:hypothetical protein
MKILKIIIATPFVWLAACIALLALYATFLVFAGLVGVAHAWLFGNEIDRQALTHVTIYVDTELQQAGGVVVIAGIPVDTQKWLQIKKEAKEEVNNLAMLDPQNPKLKQVKSTDLHSGVIIASAASTIEIYYPKDGSYTYNFLSLPTSVPSQTSAAISLLQTKVVSGGSASRLKDPETGEFMDWPSVAVVSVLGNKYSESWARFADAAFSNIDETDFSQAYTMTKSATTRTRQVTIFGLNKYFVEKTVPN